MPGQPTGGLHEQNANTIIAQWLNATGRSWNAQGERTRAIIGSNDRPDIVIAEGGRMPVIVECEYDDKPSPAVADAQKRLGKTLVNETRPFTEVIAVGIAAACKHDSETQFRQRLQDNEPILTIQLVSQAGDNAVKVWPNRPLPATPNDLVAYCEYAQVPQAVIDQESASVARQIDAAGRKLLEGIALTSTAGATLAALRRLTGCDHDEAATRTAAAIWLIAIDLQNDLAQYSADLRALNLKATGELKDTALLNRLTRDDILAQWRIIAGVNYLPVIELAIDTLSAGAMGDGLADVLEHLHQLSVQLNALHAKHIYNFAGELWQRIVPDREERAAHYTQPEIAELLSALAADRFDGWTAPRLAALNLMDAASGTGTLLGAGERALRRRYLAQGGSNPNLHQERMENHIYAMDVNGIAGTLTAKRLTDLNVEQDYAGSNIAVITDPAGSLLLLDPAITGVSNVLGYRNATPTPGIGGELGYFHIQLGGIHWSLMNPPYNRPRRGRQQATKGLERPRAAAKKRQYLMSNGPAGLASDFGNLSNIRLAPGGVYSHVLPLTAAHSGSWKAWRAELEKDFQDIVVIANVSTAELQSMSADTGMSEMLAVATKRDRRPARWQPTEILCANLSAAPTTLAEGYAMAREIAAIPANSPQGTLSHGSYCRIRQEEAGFPWSAVGNSNNDLNGITTALLEGQAYDPVTLSRHQLALPIATLGELAETGPTHHNIGHLKGHENIGAFEWTPLEDLAVAPAQQAMWVANGKTQTTIATLPTHGGNIIRTDLAKQMVQHRSQWFIKRGMRWTSQATAIAHTSQPCHGGRAWNALDVNDDCGKAIALYYNSIFGGIVQGTYGSTQHPGRAQLQVKAIPGLPCPAFHADTPEAEHARALADQHFQELSELPLQPFAYCFQDANRHRIDSVVAEMLGLDLADPAVPEMLTYWRVLFAGEPNVNGRQRKIVAALAQHEGK